MRMNAIKSTSNISDSAAEPTVNTPTIIAILKRHQAAVTQNRIIILKLFFQNPAGVSIANIIRISPVVLDRTTVYRTIRFLLQNGIVAVVPSSNNRPKYILAKFLPAPNGNLTEDQCIYFVCHECGQTEMLRQSLHLTYSEPTNYRVMHHYVVLEGICGICNGSQ